MVDRSTALRCVSAMRQSAELASEKDSTRTAHVPAASLSLWADYLEEASRSQESVRSEEKFWVVEAVNEDDTTLSPPAYWYGGFVGSTVAGHVGSDIHALCTRFQNAQTAEYVKCLLRNAKINPDRGHHWKIFKHVIQSPARVAEGEERVLFDSDSFCPACEHHCAE